MAKYYPTTLFDLRHKDELVKHYFNSIWAEATELRRQAGKAAPKKGQGKRASKGKK
jgi:hypothetical protein